MESAWALARGGGGAKGDFGAAPGDGAPSGAVSTATAASIASDPVLLYIATRMSALHRLASTAAEAGSRAGDAAPAGIAAAPHGSASSFGGPTGSALSADVQQWEVGAGCAGRAQRCSDHDARGSAVSAFQARASAPAAPLPRSGLGARLASLPFFLPSLFPSLPDPAPALFRAFRSCGGTICGSSGLLARAATEGQVTPPFGFGQAPLQLDSYGFPSPDGLQGAEHALQLRQPAAAL